MATLAALRWRPWLVVTVVVLVALMQGIPWLDLGGFQGRYLGAVMTVTWCAGLGILLLGVVRQHASRFTLRTLAILVAVIAVYLGLVQTVRPFIPTIIVAAGLSIAMLYEVQRVGTERQPYRGRLSRIIMAVGGSLMLAHSLRVLGYVAAIEFGLVRLPS